MELGLYAAATGMMAQQTIQDTLAQNIANANTPGYKQDVPTFKAIHGMAMRRAVDGSGSGASIGEVGMGVSVDKMSTDWQTGPLMTTNNALDASLETGQFFALESPPVVSTPVIANHFSSDPASTITMGATHGLGKVSVA